MDVKELRSISLAEVAPTTEGAVSAFYLKTHRREWESEFLFPPVKTAEGMVVLVNTDEGTMELRYRSPSLLPPVLLFPSGAVDSLRFREESDVPVSVLSVTPTPHAINRPLPLKLLLVGERVVEVVLSLPPAPRARNVLSLFGEFTLYPHFHRFSVALSEIYEKIYEVEVGDHIVRQRERLLQLEEVVWTAKKILRLGEMAIVPLPTVENFLSALPPRFWRVLCVPGGFATELEVNLPELKALALSVREPAAESLRPFGPLFSELRRLAEELPEEPIRLGRSEFPYADLRPTFRSAKLVKGREFVSFFWLTAEKGRIMEFAVARPSLARAAEKAAESVGRSLHSFAVELAAEVEAGEVVV